MDIGADPPPAAALRGIPLICPGDSAPLLQAGPVAHRRGTLRLATPPLRPPDRWLRHGADAAGGGWFLGQKREGDPIAGRMLVRSYRPSPRP